MKHTLSDGLNLYYEYYQKSPQSKTVVFLNGLSQSTLSWFPFVNALKSDYNILLIDNIFQGQSDKQGNYRTFDEHASDVCSLFQTLGLQKVFLAGISYGGAVAQRIMVNHTDYVEKAMLLSTFAYKTAYFNEIGFSWKRALQVDGYGLMFDVMLPMVLGKYYFESPLIPVDELRKMRGSVNENRDALLKLMRATEESGDYRPKLAKIKVPTLVVQGESDILTTPEMGRGIADALPDASFVVLPRKGHTLNLEAIPETIALLRDFVKN